MPWLPEFFSAPVLERILRQGADARVAAPVPYFAGVQSGESDSLVKSFAGEPELPSTFVVPPANSPPPASMTTPTHRSAREVVRRRCTVLEPRSRRRFSHRRPAAKVISTATEGGTDEFEQ